MKNIQFLLSLFVLFSFLSCSSDDSSNDKEITPNPSVKEWIPSKINLGSSGLNLFSEDYPHIEGCEKDYIRIIENNTAIFFTHEESTCEITETNQPWNRSGNNISLVIFDTPITGTIISETNMQMIVESDASQYSNFILLLYPEFSSYIEMLNGMKIQLILDRK